MKNKKGISPLIATVLILGFTVALAAVIMTWGTGFTKKMQTQTEETANVQVICATDVVFDVKSVCNTSTNYQILIQNDGKENIKKWKLRFYEDETKAISIDDNTRINAFGLEKITITATEGKITKDAVTLLGVRKVEAIPIIEKGGADVVCSQNVDAYGDASGGTIDKECA